MNPTALVTANVWLRKSASGRIGSAARDSCQTNAGTKITLATMSPITWGDPQRPRRAAETREEHDCTEAAGEQQRPEVVHRVAAGGDRHVERDRDHRERDRPDRDVDVEDPAPAEVVDEEPAEERPDHGREAEHRTEVALVLAALARRDDVADDREGDDHQAACPEALQRAEADQLRHRLRETAEHRAEQEDDDRALEHPLAPVQITELAVERAGDRGREEVGGDHPGQVGDAAQVADDRRERRRDDRLVERREQQHEHQRAEDRPHARLGLEGCVRHVHHTTNEMKLLRYVTIRA